MPYFIIDSKLKYIAKGTLTYCTYIKKLLLSKSSDITEEDDVLHGEILREAEWTGNLYVVPRIEKATYINNKNNLEYEVIFPYTFNAEGSFDVFTTYVNDTKVPYYREVNRFVDRFTLKT